MKKKHEDLLGAVLVLLIAFVLGSVVATWVYFDGLCAKTLLLMTAWLAATSILWSVPFVQWSLPFIFKEKFKNREALVDERGLMIFKNSVFAAHIVSWFYFMAACFAAWRIAGANGPVPVNVIPLIFVGGVMLFQFAYVISSLVQERAGWNNGE